MRQTNDPRLTNDSPYQSMADQRPPLRLVSRRSLLPVPSSPLRKREHQGTIGRRAARFRSPRRSRTLARSPAPPHSGPRRAGDFGRGSRARTAGARRAHVAGHLDLAIEGHTWRRHPQLEGGAAPALEPVSQSHRPMSLSTSRPRTASSTRRTARTAAAYPSATRSAKASSRASTALGGSGPGGAAHAATTASDSLPRAASPHGARPPAAARRAPPGVA
jgi:hypothetical protein